MTTAVIDKLRVRRSFDRAATEYDAVAVLQREIANRLLERLDYVRLEPQRVLDLGAGTGYALDALQRRYRKARIIAVDFAHGMLLQARRRGSWWRRPLCVCADAEALPFSDGAVDLIVSNATLQWCDLPLALAECRRVLRPGGLLMFTTFGRDTLIELRQAWSAVDGDSHVSPFLDLHDIGDALVQARFTDAVIDVERLQLTYAAVRDLMLDLKTLGAHNATLTRPRGLTGRTRVLALEQAYEIHRSDGRLPASYEVVYGHAWIPETTVKTDQQRVQFSCRLPTDN
ncbi:malonyl-[acyl-carrier protein] O-methyltransferase BioC [Chromatium weissei]|nr:malonyl-[acyl-carrier protein] O-methyltransferase BioC [Chromatium weissei]